MYGKNIYPICEQATDGGEGTGGTTGGNKDNGDTKHNEQMEILTQSVGLLAKGLEELRGNQSSITEALARLAEGTGQTHKEQQKLGEELFGDDVDLEQLSRKDFAKLIQASINQALEAKLSDTNKNISAKLDDLASRFESKNANEQINKTAEQNPDFWEWSTEIKKILSENPTLSVNRAYNLVKSENPDKVQKLKAKYEKAPEKKKDVFIGLTPTSSRIGGADGTGKMTQKDAAEKAFESVMANLGDALSKNPSIV